MKVGIGYSDNPESNVAGAQAVKTAVAQAGRDDACDMVLLFSTAQHDQKIMRQAIAAVIGDSVPVYGGCAAGIITNEYFGYAGDQIVAACIWLDDVSCEVLMEEGMNKGEEETGRRLGRRLAESGVNPASPVMLLYDTFDFTDGFRMLTATKLLEGIEKGLGFFPDLAGMGMMGSHTPAPTKQWLGKDIGEHNAIALAFAGNIQMDSVIMHGCYPATGYYTVTKAVGQVILEINGKPAIQFIDELLDSAVAPEQYPFFLTFGINHGERWGEYDEDYYASRLCLAVDRDSGGIVMFEPDMVEGTEFQLMFRTLNPDYVKPKIEKVFDELDGREPVFAVYINCAGRCAGYAGNDVEDAPAVQSAVAERVPVLGLYTGVEIASIGGRPRGLDWTGVFCLFSQNKNVSAANEKLSAKPVWNTSAKYSGSKEASVETMTRLSEQNAAKVLALDAASIVIRHELEQKRRGFNLLAELSVSLRQNASNENVFIPATRRINAALNMQRTVVLLYDGKGSFSAEVLQGYTANEKIKFAGLQIKVPDELLDLDKAVMITGADPAKRFMELRELLGIPYFISSPVILQGEVYALLITGRLVETTPYLVRLSRSDMETVQAVSSLLASILTGQRLAIYEERNKIMVDAMIVGCLFWDENGDLTDCNKEALSMFGLSDKKELIERFYRLSPEYQPDGRKSEETSREYIINTFINGESKFKWMHKMPDGELFSTEITLIRVPKGEDYTVVGYIRDLREQEAARAKMDEARELAEKHIKTKNEILASISHEIRTPLNAIQAMARITVEAKDITESQQNIILQGLNSIQLLTSAVETILDFTKLDSDQFFLETGEFSIRELIDRINGIFRKDAEAKSLAFDISVDPDLPDFVIGDGVRLRQALSNIVVNAIKFTEKGGVGIHVYHKKIDNGEKVLLNFEVRDTGIGIDDEQMAEIFTPLFSGDMSYTRKYGGLGMGLPVSSSLITLMGGNITCESRLGEGSIFRVVIPLTLPKDEAAMQKASPATSGVDMLRGLNVLVVEDNNINQIIMEELLTSIGVKVTMAYNGIQAIDQLKKDNFDVVLMDIQMPEMDGLTATTLIRADGKYDKLPILAMTANVGKEHYEESIKAGMNDHLSKPVDMEQLYSALLKWGRPADPES